MLAVQVQYWDYVERKRHNVVTERQNDKNLQIQEFDTQTRRLAVEETGRHNLVMESQGWATISETQRHNIATEKLQEQSNYINLYRAETDRLNYGVNKYNAETNRMNANTNAAMVQVQWYNAETQRTSVANTNWYNQQQVELQQDRNNISRFQSVTGAATSISQAETAQTNAATNYYNAQISADRNRIQEQYNTQIVGIEKAKTVINAWQKGMDQAISMWKIGTDTITKGWKNLYEQTAH